MRVPPVKLAIRDEVLKFAASDFISEYILRLLACDAAAALVATFRVEGA